MPQKQNIIDQEISLQDKINRAKDAEDRGDLCRQIKFILFEQMGYRLRHKVTQWRD